MGVKDVLEENKRRNAEINRTFNPITGEGAILDRVKFVLSDFALKVQYIPERMMKIPLVRQLAEAGSIKVFLEDYMDDEYTEQNKQTVIEQFCRIRARYDFCFFAAFYVFIKAKGGGDDINFVLNRPQRRLIERFERKRIAGKPIRLILLKARQWGGSTATQIYMAWLQLMHSVGLNSLIVGHIKDASTEVKEMFKRMIEQFPVSMLHKLGESYDANEAKLVGVGNTGNIHRIPQRNCNIKIGSAEKPDSARGGDYNLVHCTEVGLWKATEGKTPEDIIQSACSGIALKPLTMIVYESTAKGTGNFFHREYVAAKDGVSQFEPLFVAWYEIDLYRMEFDNYQQKKKFAEWLYSNRNNENTNSDREENGKYLWWLWQRGATLEAINWYILERSKYNDHGKMASEYPSDDVEAFAHSGERVFDKYQVEELRKTCKNPKFIGDVYGDDLKGKEALANLRFKEDHQGLLWIWALPEIDDEEQVTERYVVSVDIGGRSDKADWSVISVIDRLFLMEGGKPSVVAQLRGHMDHDLLAWKAAQIAMFYDKAKLVIESNTLETKDKERQVDGDQSGYILDQIKGVYDNLYERTSNAEEIKEGAPSKLGYHTNTATKPLLVSTLQTLIRENGYVERDQRALDEYLCYEKKLNGSYGAITGKHDDILMSRAIGLRVALFEMPMPTVIRKVQKRLFRERQKRNRKAATAATM